MTHRRALSGLAFALTCGCSTAALAQASDQGAAPSRSASANQIGEVVVTARRVEERLQSVPIQVTAITANELASSVVQRNDDLKFVAPSLQVSGTGVGGQGAFTEFSLRGIGNALNTSVAVQPYFNEVPVNTVGLNYQFFDMDSVQVLEGPQGVAFGRNSTAGAILWQTAKPSSQFDAFVEGQIGNFNHQELTGMVNIPLADTLQVRLAGNWQKRDGIIENVLGPDLFNRDHYSMRASISFQPTDRLSNDLVASYFSAEETNGTGAGGGAGGQKVRAVSLPATSGTGACQGVPITSNTIYNARQYCFMSSRDAAGNPVGLIPMTPAQLAAYGPLPYFVGTGLPGGGPSAPFGDLWYQNQLLGTLGSRTTAMTPVPVQESDSWFISNRTEYDVGETALGDMTVRNILGFNSNYVFAVGQYGPPVYVGLTGSGGPLKSSTVTEEFQVFGDVGDGALNWLVGAFYATETRKQDGRTLPSADAPYEPRVTTLQTIPQEQLNFLYDVTGGIAGQSQNFTTATFDSKSMGLYARGIYRVFTGFEVPSFLEKTRLTAGYRITRDELEFAASAPVRRLVTGDVQIAPPGSGLVVGTPRQALGCSYFLINGTPLVSNITGACSRGGSADWQEPNWEIGLDDQITDNVMVYVKQSHGYKAGGANSFSNSGALFYDPEFVDTFEVGVKADWRIGPVALRTNASWYDSTFKDIQTNQLVQNPVTLAAGTTIVNQNEERAKGYNIGFTAIPITGLRLSYNYAHFDNVYETFRIASLGQPIPATCTAPAPVTGLTGLFSTCSDVPANGPHNTYTLGAGYTLPLSEDWGEITLNADYYHQDGFTTISTTTLQPTTTTPYDILNASLQWRSVLGRPVSLTIWGRNLEGKEAVTLTDSRTTAVFSTYIESYRLEPRTFGVTLRYSFQ